MQYVIYGIASFFFLYGIILLAEGFYTTSAVKELHSEFKTTICGRCISGMVCTNNPIPKHRALHNVPHRDFALQQKDRWRISLQEQSAVVTVTDDVGLVPSLCPQFVFLTYILGVAWLGVFGFSAVPVFLFYNMWSTCATMRSPMANLTNIDSICVDVRQYGKKENWASFGSHQMASLLF